LAGLLGLPRMLTKRRDVQRLRRVSDDELLGVLTPIDNQHSDAQRSG